MANGTMTGNTAPAHPWRFFRAGGFDQVRLDSGKDLLALDALDQKLWVALSCPVRGLEFDETTLALMDSDHDGHIRPPELIAALKWAGSLLKDPDALVNSADGLALAAIDDGTEAGQRLLDSARRILHNLGKDGSAVISATDTGDTSKIFAQTRFNGDGIVPAEASDEPQLRLVIAEIIECMGAETDRGGLPGLSLPRAEHFFSEARAYIEWQAQAESDAAILPLGADTARAGAAVEVVCAKVEDFFVRCRLAAFDKQAQAALNGSEADFAALGRQRLDAENEEIAALPLAAVTVEGLLPLGHGVNPAWQAAIAALRDDAVLPLLGERTVLNETDWKALLAQLAPYRNWLAARIDTPLESIGLERLREILAGGHEQAIRALVDQDLALAAEANAIAEVDRLVRYCRDLAVLANNFVSFRDFYALRAKAVFQAGTLYLDGRSCDLCLRVNDAAKHGALAGLSGIYLAYCECTRDEGAQKMTIAAAFTAGDAGQLMAGRNGVFYDRQGRDWNATVTKLVEHPISVREAFWSPYRKFARLVNEQMQKFAAAKSSAVEGQAASVAGGSIPQAGAGKPPLAQAFDIGKFAGIFAAIGLAVGAIGTALAALASGLLGLPFWQMPLALAGLALVISGPFMLLAWFRLRARNLAPLLDANGWAVNARAKINIPFGTALTQLAVLPSGAERTLKDPYAEKSTPWGIYLLAVILTVAAYFWVRGAA
jgi:hypothetical protein